MIRRHGTGWVLMCVLALSLGIAAEADAAFEFYVSVQTAKKGTFLGESAREKAKGKIPAIRLQYSVVSPRDIATGQSSGKRQHQPLVITKEWGASSPQFFQALVRNEVLKSVLLEFVRTNQNGEEYVYQTIKLTDVLVSSIRLYTEAPSAGQHRSSQGELEDISFTFRKIEISNVDGKTNATDDWRR